VGVNQQSSRWEQWRARAGQLKLEIYALYLAFRDPRVPWYARAFLALVVGYAFSPIDLIPDFIPVVGYLDDLVLVPLGIALALKLIPRSVLEECRAQSRERVLVEGHLGRGAAVVIAGIWLVSVLLVVLLAWRAIR
jgi:uncharacterized membrane protein YkvA (DUF1232 family)